MERAAVSLSAPPSVVFHDGLGERRLVVDPTGRETFEWLCLRSELASVPSFEFALRERVSRLAGFRHASYARVRSVERLNDPDATLTVVSEHAAGVRLSEILSNVEAQGLALDINSALCLIRQLVPAVALLHESSRDASHGALGPERILVTPQGRVVIVEHVCGSALEQLRFSQERYWTELRVPLPRSAGPARFDQRADVLQIGITALSLVLGRLLREDEFPSRLGEVVASTWAVSARGGFEPLPPGLRGWLGRALLVDPRNAFATASDARDELDKLLGEGDLLASPASLDAFLKRYQAEARPAPQSHSVETPAPVSLPALVLPPPSRHVIAAEPPAVAAAPPVAVFTPLSVPVLAAPVPVRSHVLPELKLSAPEIRKAALPEIQPIAAAVAWKPPAPAAKIPAEPKVHVDPVRAAASEPLVDALVNSLHAAQDQWREPAPLEPDAPQLWKRPMVLGGAVALVAILVGGAFASRRIFAPQAPVRHTGTLVVTSNPTGAATIVDGEARGMTPITLTLSAGSHVVELRSGGGTPRSIPVNVSEGSETSQYIELPKTGPTLGQLQVRTEPAGAEVTVDGVPRGRAPALVADLTAGEHVVQVASEVGSMKQTVTIEAGATASLVVPLSAPEGAALTGWVSVTAPVDVQVFEHDKLLGTSASDRIMVGAGKHDLDIVNDVLGYRSTRSVQVAAGKVAPIKIDMPNGTIALNATPWAEVWIDGEKVGETPIGNFSLSIGAHDVVFRNPDFGEQHHTAMVTLKEPARLSVDLRKK
jgi:hypothetical protein